MKCLEKEPAPRRYETANGPSPADLQRHLSNQPVLARPPSTAYKPAKGLAQKQKSPGLPQAAVFHRGWLLEISFTTWQTLKAQKAERGKSQALLTAEHHLYGASMNLARQAWEEGKF